MKAQAVKEKCVVIEYCSFPNGSAYEKEILKDANDGSLLVEMLHNQHYLVLDSGTGELAEVSFTRKSVGPGTDLGVHYCTCDQVLVDLIDPENELDVAQSAHYPNTINRMMRRHNQASREPEPNTRQSR